MRIDPTSSSSSKLAETVTLPGSFFPCGEKKIMTSVEISNEQQTKSSGFVIMPHNSRWCFLQDVETLKNVNVFIDDCLCHKSPRTGRHLNWMNRSTEIHVDLLSMHWFCRTLSWFCNVKKQMYFFSVWLLLVKTATFLKFLKVLKNLSQFGKIYFNAHSCILARTKLLLYCMLQKYDRISWFCHQNFFASISCVKKKVSNLRQQVTLNVRWKQIDTFNRWLPSWIDSAGTLFFSNKSSISLL